MNVINSVEANMLLTYSMPLGLYVSVTAAFLSDMPYHSFCFFFLRCQDCHAGYLPLTL